MSLNRVVMQGRLVAEPEMRQTSSGVAVANFRLAVDRDFKDKETGERGADFFNLTAWRGTAEFIVAYFHKGDQMIVDGKLQQNQYQDRDGNNRVATQVIVESAYFAGSSGKRESNGGSYTQKKQEGSGRTTPAPVTNFNDLTDDVSNDELPF